MDTKNKQLNILAILPHSIGGRLTTSSIIDGLRQNDFVVTIFDELKDDKSSFGNLFKKHFDYMVGYDFSALKLKIDNNLPVPVINYFSDVIELPTAGEGYKEYKKHLNRNDVFSFYWDEALYNEAKHEIKNLFYLPHFVNTEIYKNTNINPQYDIMFAGRLDTDYRLNFWITLIKELPNLNFCWFAIEKHYKDAISRLNENNKTLLKQTYKGFIDNEKDMAMAINNTKIVLNMNAQGKSSLNYRTFQTMACEKLLLCDYRKETEKLFGKNSIIVYNDISDAIKKIGTYLHNEVNYNEVVKNARACILQSHNAKLCVKQMIEKVQELR